MNDIRTKKGAKSSFVKAFCGDEIMLIKKKYFKDLSWKNYSDSELKSSNKPGGNKEDYLAIFICNKSIFWENVIIFS